MRQISADLAAVQKVRSPRARVSVTVEERGATWGARALRWHKLVDNEGQGLYRPVALCSTSDGRMLRFRASGTAMWMDVINDPTSATNWQVPSDTVQLATHTAYALCALRTPAGGSTIRLFFINGNNGNVYYRVSMDDGATWGSDFTVYSGGDAVADLVVAYIEATGFGQERFVGFTTVSSGVYRARFGNGNASSWTIQQYGQDYWRAAGIVVDRTGLSTGQVRVLAYRQRSQGLSRLRSLRFDGTTFDQATDLDRTSAGLVGLALNNFRFFQLPEMEAQIGIGGEGGFGAGAYEGVVGLTYAGELVTDETIMLPDLRTTLSYAYTGLGEVDNDLYVAGTIAVWRGEWQGDVTSETMTPIRYDYDENQIEIEFPVTAGSQSLKVGQVLKVDRTLSWGNQSGTETVRFYIVRVDRGTDKVVVVALDALGFLGSSRCRRPMIVSDGTTGVATAMRRAAGRVGLEVDVDNSALESASVLGMTLAPAESLLSAAYRMGSQSEWYLVPANDGSFGLSMITPGTTISGDYNDTPHEYGESANQQVVYRAAEVVDFRQLGFSYVLGTVSTDPQDGSAVGMAAGAWVANTRPISFSLTNRTYNTTARVTAAATAEGARQKKLDINAEMTTPANLGLELYDVVEVTEPALGWSAKQFRVRRVQERWDRGQLTQRVWMGSED